LVVVVKLVVRRDSRMMRGLNSNILVRVVKSGGQVSGANTLKIRLGGGDTTEEEEEAIIQVHVH
jgi:hypothetical protein